VDCRWRRPYHAAVVESGPVQIYLLGEFRVDVRGHALGPEAWPRRKARQLLKCLLTRPHRKLQKEEALDLFWPDSRPRQAATNLRSSTHVIRQALDLEQGVSLITVDDDSLSVSPTVWVDADAFEAEATRARMADDPIPGLERAVSLYAGDYLPDDQYEDWTTDRREALRQTWLEVAFALANAHELAGLPDRAAALMQRVVSADATNERAAQLLMRLLLEKGDRPEALRTFQRLETALRDDVGVAPAAETRRLHRQALSRDEPERREQFLCAYAFPSPARFVGRDTEIARLLRIIQRGRTAGQAILLSAPAGTGKSALVGQAIVHARTSGMLCLAGGSYDDRSGIPLAAFQEALADYLVSVASQLSDLNASPLHEAMHELRIQLGFAHASSEDPSTGRMRLFSAVLALLRAQAERGPVLLCLEDLHAADAATLHLLHYLIRQCRRLPVVFVGTFRDDEITPGEPLGQLVAQLERERVVERLRLGPLDRTETHQLVEALIGVEPRAQLSESLYSATDGNPLFLEQLVLALRDSGRLDQDLSEASLSITRTSDAAPQIQELVGQRLARLSDRAVRTLEQAAVLGRTFDHDTVLAMVEPETESDLLLDLDEGLRARLVREVPVGYTFTHALLREAVYWSLTRPKRMLLHGRAGEVLEQRIGPEVGGRAAELAHHFALAGHAQRDKALTYSLEAGRAAARLSFYFDARQQFARACDLLTAESGVEDSRSMLEALEGRGQAERRLGMWSTCEATFKELLSLSTAQVVRARAREAIALSRERVGDPAGALAAVDAGLAEISDLETPETPAVYIQLQYEKALLLYPPGQFCAVQQIGEQMLDRARTADSLDLVYRAETVLGWGYMGQGLSASAVEHFTRALVASEQTSNRLGMAVVHENLGMQYLDSGEFATARQHLSESITLFRRLAREARAMNALLLLGGVYLADGDIQQAQKYGELAITLASEEQDRRESDCHELLGRIASLRADWSSAGEQFETALRGHERIGNLQGIVQSETGLGFVHESLGDWIQAREHYERAVASVQSADSGPHTIAAHTQLGRLLLRMGDVRGAGSIQRALDVAERIPESVELGPALLAGAELAARREDYAAALRLVERALQARGTAAVIVRAHAFAARLHAHLGRQAQAQSHAADALQGAERLGAPLLLCLAALARASALAVTNVAAAESSFRAALQHADSARSPYARGRVLQVWGTSLQSAADLRADDLLRSAEEVLSTFAGRGSPRELSPR
jgi:DNA-binding SARP family transcriptional activator/tetratricopeptide (TPR) repeat protein